MASYSIQVSNCRNCSDRTVWFPEAVRTLPVPVSLGLRNLKQAQGGIGFYGTKGTMGTQANFLTLFNSDHAKVAALDKCVTELCGFQYAYPITSQMYHRRIYADVLAPLAQRRIRSRLISGRWRTSRCVSFGDLLFSVLG
jgi:hypothetical protein